MPPPSLHELSRVETVGEPKGGGSSTLAGWYIHGEEKQCEPT